MILVKNVRLFPRTPDAPAVDVEITEGRFSRLSPAEDAAPGPTTNGTGTTPTGAEVIAISPIPHTGLGVAINDRLNRAAAER